MSQNGPVAYTSGIGNNCLFHSIAHSWLSLPIETIHFLQEIFPIYKKIMNDFYTHHKIPVNQQVDFKTFISIMQSPPFSNPITREIIWGPVLRQVTRDLVPANEKNELSDGVLVAVKYLDKLGAHMGVGITLHTEKLGSPHIGNANPIVQFQMKHSGLHYEFYFNSPDQIQKTTAHNAAYVGLKAPTTQQILAIQGLLRKHLDAAQKQVPAPKASLVAPKSSSAAPVVQDLAQSVEQLVFKESRKAYENSPAQQAEKDLQLGLEASKKQYEAEQQTAQSRMLFEKMLAAGEKFDATTKKVKEEWQQQEREEQAKTFLRAARPTRSPPVPPKPKAMPVVPTQTTVIQPVPTQNVTKQAQASVEKPANPVAPENRSFKDRCAMFNK